jgi:hypothetical protein
MIGRLVATLDRRSPATCRLTLAAIVLIVLLVVVSGLAPSPQPVRRRVPPPAGPSRTRRMPTAPGSRPISPGGLVGARRVADRFLVGYLRFLYGRGSARSIEAITPGLRLQLGREPALVTPGERQRHPRVVSLSAVEQAPAAVVMTGLIADDGVAAYAVRIALRAGRHGWLVTGVDG